MGRIERVTDQGLDSAERRSTAHQSQGVEESFRFVFTAYQIVNSGETNDAGRSLSATVIFEGVKVFKGEPIPAEWVLPQKPILKDELDQWLQRNQGMPSGHYAKFGGEDLAGYPEVWQKRQIP